MGERNNRGGGGYGPSHAINRAGAIRGGFGPSQEMGGAQEEEKLNLSMHENKSMPTPRWTYNSFQLENVLNALKYAGMAKCPSLTNDTEFTYNAIRTGAFSASALET